jgi:amyloid beta precursor protein binding protein 1
MQQLVREYGFSVLPENLSKNHAMEIVRYGGSELHTISALIGGVGAQEAVKIITHQYIPLDNTFIYNGIVGCGETYEL